jgi:choline dehydrogenase-like flavoprotein
VCWQQAISFYRVSLMLLENFFDAHDEQCPTKLNSSICIIGAGAAGITLARNFKNTDVLLIESGSFELDGKTQGLYKGKNVGLPYHDLLGCRLRYFGGTTNHWGGYCRPNDPIDYEGRKSMNMPKWPINEVDLAPYMSTAAKELGLSDNFFDIEPFLDKNGIPKEQLIDNVTSDLYTKMFQLTNKKRFSTLYREELGKQNNLRVYYNLNVVHIQLSSNGKDVSSIKCKTLSGKTVIIEAEKFILASHAIENARLLLNSNDIEKNGIGNKYDHVGRYFMEHIHIKASKLIPSEKFPKLYNQSILKDLNLNANISFTDEFLRDKNILQYYCRFLPVSIEEDVVESISDIRKDINSPFSRELYEDIGNVMNNIAGVSKHIASRYGISNPKPAYYILDQRIEQAPNPNSRVVISKDLDALGVPQANLQWELNEHDYRTFKVGQQKIIKEISMLGGGRFIVEDITPELVDDRATGHYHHIGTTRMSESPLDGVVDSNCKVHNIKNLYLAGSSVFPTAGYSGPTMMIVALSLRLAEHLSKMETV